MEEHMKKALITASILLAAAASAQDATWPTLPLDHPAAPFVMTYAYAQSVGATAEWRKMEGTALDQKNRTLYIADAEIAEGMSDGEGDIRLEENLCGVVYMGKLDASYEVHSLNPIVSGGPYTPGASEDEDGSCDPNNISSPDNVAVDGMGRLWIGEDTGYHENNMLWVFDPQTEKLTRVATVPLGAEVTGLHVSASGTVFMNVQHPDADNLYPFNRGVVGVIAGFNANTDEVTELTLPEGDDKKIARTSLGAYQILARVGEAIPGAQFGEAAGQIDDVTGERVLDFCNNPDGNMFLPNNEAGSEGYLYTNFECTPGGISKLLLQQDDAGNWQVTEGNVVDFAAVNGTWNNCNASVTPWNTGLSGEEYPAESAENWDEYGKKEMAEYLGAAANPYDYGYPVELTPGEGVGTDVVKHYAMGRTSVENATIMPDEKTAYIGDDGSDRVMYKFVADEAGNLQVGTLYAAKVTQDGETLNLKWIELGHGDSETIAQAIRSLDKQFAGK